MFPVLFFGNEAANPVTEYTLKFKAFQLAEKPLFEKEDQLTDKDPTYRVDSRDTRAHFKPYPLALKTGKTYVIDLVKGGPGMDPYLYLEAPDGKVVGRDDDSGGDLNARLIYTPASDGEFRIIATTLVPATGDFRLTVREAK